MRVLLTTDTVGGVWTFTKSLVAGLLEQGHDAALVSFGRLPLTTQRAWCTSMEQRSPERFRYVASDVPLEWMEDNDRAYSAGLPFLVEAAASFKPDLIHSNQFCFGSLPISVPVVVTAHSDVKSWATACRPEGLTRSRWLTQYEALVDQGLLDAAAVVAPTRWMLEALKKNFSFSVPEHVIHNGRSLSTPSSAKVRELQAVSVGRLWDEAKNLSLLMATVSPVPILVAGEQRREIAVIPAQSGAVTLLGHLCEDDLIDLFSRSSIYIVSSLYEPFGLAPVEAALCGCAILANDIASLREVWGDSALYFTDAASLSDLLKMLSRSSEALDKARSRATARARLFSSALMTSRYLALYDTLLQTPASSRILEQITHAC